LLNCKNCGSADIRLFKVVHEAGTSTSTSTGSIDGDLGETYSTSAKTTTQTIAAKRCSPPSDPADLVAALAAIPALLLGLGIGFKAGYLMGSFWAGVIVFVLATCVLVIGTVVVWGRMFSGTVEKYRNSLAQWHKSWLCSRCGSTTFGA
jgi:hypothetical protein